MSTNRIGLLLEPLDVLFFRDGRPFEPAMHGESGLPMPQTLAGAIWTAVLRQHDTDFERLGESVREGMSFGDALEAIDRPRWLAQIGVQGPWLAYANDGDLEDVLVPVPAVLQKLKEGEETSNGHTPRLRRLRPLSERLPGWDPPLPDMRPLWMREPAATEAANGFIGQEGLQAFLNGGDLDESQVKSAAELYGLDSRTGIAIDSQSLTSEEGLIYAARFLALNDKVGFYAEVGLPPEASANGVSWPQTVSFGGEGRRARVHVLERPWSWPAAENSDAGGKPLVVLTTPGLFRQRWYPGAFDGRLAAAAVPGNQPVSGWDLARGGPKPTRFAAQAGSVYFLNESLEDWPAALSDDAFDQQQGWGCYLTGVWTDE